MGKLSTPDWIREGFDSKADWEKSQGIKKKEIKGKTFKIKKCPKCGSNDVGVVLGEEEGRGSGEWECKKCKWKGRDIKIEEVGEDEFLKATGEEK
jgi:hypothetical protein